MPLSKARNRDRMREYRLHKRLLSVTGANGVQPKPLIIIDKPIGVEYIDGDGYPVYDD